MSNEIGLDFVRFSCVGQENKVVDGEMACSGFAVEVFFTDCGSYIKKPIFCEENWQAFCGIVYLERGDDCGDGEIGGLCS
uniref:Uncharacterized protein n=1 Tax=Romanomermis culicivorax TaxID=13658 RepID=A0A915JDH2_ROMCU